jgi:putative spermidine/putrescine transport system permease protein
VIWLLLLPALLFMSATFLIPLAKLLQLSLSDPRGTFAAYLEILGSTVYRRALLHTLSIALGVTAISIALAWPTAFLLTRLKGVRLQLAFWCVLAPLWISVLVRTFSWMLLLESHGPVNRLLRAAGLTASPLKLLFNDTGVYIGMVHVLLPYAVLPIYAALVRIDPRLALASEGLGAGPLMTLRRVHLPLSLPGAAAAAVLVFLLALGFFVTPALLGGGNHPNVAMLIESLVDERLAWPLAGAASFVLLTAVMALLILTGRFVPIRRLTGVS